jgi:hypothetical protein
MVDATIVKGATDRAQKGEGGMATKILALTDALGNLVRFVLLPGHRFDTGGVAPSSTISPLRASSPTRPFDRISSLRS